MSGMYEDVLVRMRFFIPGFHLVHRRMILKSTLTKVLHFVIMAGYYGRWEA